MKILTMSAWFYFQGSEPNPDNLLTPFLLDSEKIAVSQLHYWPKLCILQCMKVSEMHFYCKLKPIILLLSKPQGPFSSSIISHDLASKWTLWRDVFLNCCF